MLAVAASAPPRALRSWLTGKEDRTVAAGRRRGRNDDWRTAGEPSLAGARRVACVKARREENPEGREAAITELSMRSVFATAMEVGWMKVGGLRRMLHCLL